MARPRPEYNATSWQDIYEAVPAWESEHGVRVELRIRVEPGLASGGYVEVVLFEGGQVGDGPELVRTRQPFPVRRGSGHAGSALHCVFRALAELEANPWLWPARKRRAVTGSG